jgi:hypothetical protein
LFIVTVTNQHAVLIVDYRSLQNSQDGDYVQLNNVISGHQKTAAVRTSCDANLRSDPFGLLQFNGTTSVTYSSFYARPLSTSTEASLKVITVSDAEGDVFDGGPGQQETKSISTKVAGVTTNAKPRKTRRNALRVCTSCLLYEFDFNRLFRVNKPCWQSAVSGSRLRLAWGSVRPGGRVYNMTRESVQECKWNIFTRVTLRLGLAPV